jgi:hypothetical protein
MPSAAQKKSADVATKTSFLENLGLFGVPIGTALVKPRSTTIPLSFFTEPSPAATHNTKSVHKTLFMRAHRFDRIGITSRATSYLLAQHLSQSLDPPEARFKKQRAQEIAPTLPSFPKST